MCIYNLYICYNWGRNKKIYILNKYYKSFPEPKSTASSFPQ